jgi:hypothetical protein
LTTASVPSPFHAERYLTVSQRKAFGWLTEEWKVNDVPRMGQRLANLYGIHRNLVETKWVPRGRSKRHGKMLWRLSPLGVCYKEYLKLVPERNRLPLNGPQIETGHRIAKPRLYPMRRA